MQIALDADEEYRSFMAVRASMVAKAEEVDMARVELDTREVGALQRMATNARDLEECAVMFRRRWEREHLGT
ncbi:hypothetical protein N7466_006197 [Penicillium verhagenii]|uniref:uncharacterized protein n=1 Tax=Penicillium verhagenii TaxID=1562060 RepID=UPI00254576E5|nr:uncharacterized protein N7466_006197 [Penicillium verhagenii]KAJ5930704.1 hypothetical protein N7466_006197 [Penicillium verhagenii]